MQRRQGNPDLTPEAVFAKTLREVRKKAGISQEQLGFDSGYHRTYIGMLERGLMNPSLRTVLSLAAAMKMPAGEFVGLIEASLGPWRRPEKKVGRRPDV